MKARFSDFSREQLVDLVLQLEAELADVRADLNDANCEISELGRRNREVRQEAIALEGRCDELEYELDVFERTLVDTEQYRSRN
jgi:predicted nuclease with TOPRIM domain